MDTHRRLGLLLLLPLLLGSRCSVLGPSEETRDLREARERWEAAGLDDYTFDVRRVCFCASVEPIRVVVQDGEAVSHTVIATGEPVPAEERHLFPTVPGLFDFIEDAIEQRAHSIEATYDPGLGFPVQVFVDYKANVADEELGFEISAFTAQ